MPRENTGNGFNVAVVYHPSDLGSVLGFDSWLGGSRSCHLICSSLIFMLCFGIAEEYVYNKNLIKFS